MKLHSLNIDFSRENMNLIKKDFFASGDNFLDNFWQVDAVIYRKQITYDIQLLEECSKATEKFLDLMKSMIEVHGQQQRWMYEENQRQRYQSLQYLLAMIGSGLTVSNLSSRTLPQPIPEFIPRLKSIQLSPETKFSLWMVTISIHAAIGIIATFLIAAILVIIKRIYTRLKEQ